MFEEQLEQAPVEVPTQEITQEVLSDKEHNLRVMRERALAAERRVKEMEQQYQRPQQPPQEEYDPYDDTFVDGKTLKKERKANSDAIREIKEELTRVNNYTADIKLRSKYADFERIVNADNLEKLSILKPSHYKAVASTSDYYAAGETAYDLIKDHVFKAKSEVVDKKLEENKIKPKSSGGGESYVSNSPLTMAQDYDRRILTEDRKEQLRRQVAEIKKYS